MKLIKKLTPAYVLVLTAFLCITVFSSHAVTVMAENSAIQRQHTVVIDPGHGGEDGGATSCTGVLESQINLEIALRLDDLLHLMGHETVMIRTTDRAVYTQGDTIAEKKVSDLKQRVKIVNNTKNAVLLSIHQNQFSDGKYHGAQVFYAPGKESKTLAEKMQAALVGSVNPGSNRKSKKSDGVYLMQHIQCPGILIECGFLSNREEEAALRTPEYQKKLCAVIAATLSEYFASSMT